MRIHRAAGLAALSAVFKVYADYKQQYPDAYAPRFGEHDPSPYFTLNHRWMNPEIPEQEEDLEQHL
ncbi:unnamed protein product [Echinostoma caproni]|uniref:Secreted protein n=1 Tax=Echinostoma caproni TaxID=27848 RepID=A0A183A354_9TREM|nr:unnamed protein product [Echinostoma caproni]